MTAEASSIGAHTGLLAVVGHPVRHSLSPLMHNAAFRHDGLDYVYVALDVEPVALPAAIGGIRALGLRGANITIPHKQQVISLLDCIDPLAARVGAVNTIVNDDGMLVGYNTDVEGFRAALGVLVAGGARAQACLVAGAGGAARAVVAALIDEGASDIFLFNRTQRHAEQLRVDAGHWGTTRCTVVDQVDVVEAARQVDIVVNATSVGLSSTGQSLPFPTDVVHGQHAVLDLVYRAEPTQLVQLARARGALSMDGFEMLVRQAASSYVLWTGREPSLDVMRAALQGAGD